MAKTVVVAVRMDSQSKELLTWALVKVAETGDKVVALHVLTDCSFDSAATTWTTVVKDFDSMLAVYEGFCNLKQVFIFLIQSILLYLLISSSTDRFEDENLPGAWWVCEDCDREGFSKRGELFCNSHAGRRSHQEQLCYWASFYHQLHCQVLCEEAPEKLSGGGSEQWKDRLPE